MSLDQWIAAVAVGIGIGWFLCAATTVALDAWEERRGSRSSPMSTNPHPSTRVPPKCPACGRLTVDNAQHCPDEPGKPARWARRCLTITCRCGTIYRAGGHAAPSAPGRKP